MPSQKDVGFNSAIHECRLRHLKNRMSVEEIEKIILDYFLEGKSIIKVEYLTIDPIYCEELATAIFKTIEEKIGGHL